MPFPEEIVKQAWERSLEACECTRRVHTHFYVPCHKPLAWSSRGQDGRYGWEAHKIRTSGEDVISNCEILCADCYEAVTE